MQKKGVHISSTTLGLRFMQNAKIRQDQRDTEVAQVKIQNDEQWHLAMPQEWAESSHGQADGTSNISYESSYLPFLFPDSKSNVNSIEEKEEDNIKHKPKGRRTFGKHGREEEIVASTPTEPEPASVEEQPQSNEVEDGTNSISAHPKSISSQISVGSSRGSKKESLSLKVEPQTFLRPNVEAPRSAKRRIFEDPLEPQIARKKKKAKSRPIDS